MNYPILIRIDDVCPTMDEVKFNCCLEFLDRYHYKPLLGVIPDCKDESLNYGIIDGFWEKIQCLKQKGYPIAMHGLHHCYTQEQKGLVCNRKKSEFAGLPFETQYEMLSMGRKILHSHGLDTNTFFAPGHSFDRNTLQALQKAGFTINSDGRSYWPYECEGVLNIPVNGAFRIHFGRGLLTIALHPSADAEKTHVQLESFFTRNKERLLPWNEVTNLRRRAYYLSRIEEKANMGFDELIVAVVTQIKAMK